jgi:hypothetical protein
MAFTVASMKCSDRRTKLRRAIQILNEMVNINESADRARVQLLAAGVSDVGDTVNAILSGGGAPYATADTDITPCVDDTLSGELINLLSTNTNGISWVYAAES